MSLRFLYNHMGNRIYTMMHFWGCINSVKRIFFIYNELGGV